MKPLGECKPQLCYVADVRLICNVHADVAQPGMAESDSENKKNKNKKNTGMQMCLRVLGRHVDCFNLLTAELY